MEIMYRHLFLGLIIIIIIACKTNAQQEPGYDNESNRDIRSIAFGEEIISSVISNGLGGLKPIISLVKTQVREIIIDLLFQLMTFLRAVLHEYKILMFQRLGKYTLSDVFHFLFDGVFDFVGGHELEVNLAENYVPGASNYEQNVFPDGILLDRLIRSGDD